MDDKAQRRQPPPKQDNLEHQVGHLRGTAREILSAMCTQNHLLYFIACQLAKPDQSVELARLTTALNTGADRMNESSDKTEAAVAAATPKAP